jgi:hypothetical protein
MMIKALTTAIIGKLIHYSLIINPQCESFRLKEESRAL